MDHERLVMRAPHDIVGPPAGIIKASTPQELHTIPREIVRATISWGTSAITLEAADELKASQRTNANPFGAQDSQVRAMELNL
jgi:hypothetical protein